MISKMLIKRFDELITQAADLDCSKQYQQGAMTDGYVVDHNLYLAWKAKAKNLLVLACGENSEHYKAFISAERSSYSKNSETLSRLKSLIAGAKEDYSGGYCSSVRSMIQAEVFDSELDQATELLNNGYHSAAAVIAGVVLETTIRQLCDVEGIGHGKLDKMNSDLAKAGRYNVLVQKQVTALADVRNKAAHGQNDQFSNDDVKNMIAEVSRFLAERL
jgi:hypothetical protein